MIITITLYELSVKETKYKICLEKNDRYLVLLNIFSDIFNFGNNLAISTFVVVCNDKQIIFYFTYRLSVYCLINIIYILWSNFTGTLSKIWYTFNWGMKPVTSFLRQLFDYCINNLATIDIDWLLFYWNIWDRSHIGMGNNYTYWILVQLDKCFLLLYS